MKITSGLILFRKINNKLEVFLVHPGGPIWGKKDDGAWTIPKGLIDLDESSRNAALREFKEETGYDLEIDQELMIELGEVNLYSGKNMICYAFEKDIGEIEVKSNFFEMEWPPRSGKILTFPEADKGAYFEIGLAKIKLNKNQLVFLEKLESHLK